MRRSPRSTYIHTARTSVLDLINAGNGGGDLAMGSAGYHVCLTHRRAIRPSPARRVDQALDGCGVGQAQTRGRGGGNAATLTPVRWAQALAMLTSRSRALATEIARAKDGEVQQALVDAYEKRALPGNQVPRSTGSSSSAGPAARPSTWCRRPRPRAWMRHAWRRSCASSRTRCSGPSG